ncbi:MAG: nucleotide-diphospho-sugar transferase [Chitinispirillia bacterium]|nr:nucleotide-diphospho-sugar transferase [Chitinispirillia bacterium]
MEKYTTKSAVLFITFNKLEETKRVFEAIKNAQPPKIYLASDGARAQKQGEKEIVEGVRNYLLSAIDWDCDIKTRFSDTNQGCGRGVSNAVTWFFEHEEMGIIIEDDCLPHQFFFRFCDELLVKYKDDERVSMIAGTNEFAKYREEKSNEYFFTRSTYIWGWASYRRVWKDYCFALSFLPQLKEKMSYEELLYPLKKYQIKKRRKKFERIYKRKGSHTWDFQLLCLNLMNRQFCIVPKANLVANIGFGENATHTHNLNSPSSNIPYGELLFPLKEPDPFEENLQFAIDYHDFIMPKRTLAWRILKELSRFKRRFV